MIIKKSLLFLLIFFIAGFIGISSCEIGYTLVDSSGIEKHISPARIIELKKLEKYTLIINYFQDHGRCDVDVNDTDFILEEEKWKTSKDHLPLQLLEKITWEQIGSRNFITKINFNVNNFEKAALEIIRDCDRKSGYDEYLDFIIKQTGLDDE
ncbi:MAG: hypothetical protein OCD02_11900 [Spirochaetaceae bacterium]